MGACCGGMTTGQHKSLPENEKANNIAEKNDQCVNNGPQGDAAVTKETPVTADQLQQQHSAPDQTVSNNHTSDHCQTSAVTSPDEVELKITEPDRAEPEPAPVEQKLEQAPADVAEPATQPTPPVDEMVISDSGKKMTATEALFVSEGEGDSEPPNAVSTSVEHDVETTDDVRTSTVVGELVDTSIQRDDQQPEVIGKVVECVKPPDNDDVVAVSSEADETSSPAVVEDTPSSLTGETVDDRQRQNDVELIAEGRSVDQSPPSAASEEQTHHETTNAQPEQTDFEQPGEQLTTSTGPQVGDAPVTTACEEESGLETSGLEVEPNVEDVGEQSPPTDNESAPPAGETPVLADLSPPDVTLQEELHEVESDNAVVTASEELQPTTEVMARREDTDVPSTDGVTSSDAAEALAVDDSEVRLEQAVSSPVSDSDHIEAHPETLDARPPADEQETATNCDHVETSQRPDEHSVNESTTDIVVEPTSNSTTDTADQVYEAPPVTDQP